MDSTKTNELGLFSIDEKILWLFFIIALALFSCDMNDESDEFTGITGTINSLPFLPESHEYALWLEENQNIRLVSSFLPDNSGIFRLATAPQSQIIEDTDDMFVTIEEEGSGYTDPSIYEIAGASFGSRDNATVSSFPIASDFSTLSASINITSTNPSLISFENEMGESLLNMPSLNDGWHYTVWFEKNGTETPLLSFQNTVGVIEVVASEEINEGTIRIGIELSLIHI